MPSDQNNHPNASIKSNSNGNSEKPEKVLKFLFVSFESLSGDLAWQIKKEGHQVKVFIESKDDQDVYDGILDKVDDWQKHKDWADVIVFDDTGFGKIANSLRAQGKLVVGGSEYTDKLENNREHTILHNGTLAPNTRRA